MRPTLIRVAALAFIPLVAAASSQSGDRPSPSRVRRLPNKNEAALASPSSPTNERKVHHGTLSAWLEENLWDRMFAADVEAFKMTVSDKDNMQNYSRNLQEGENTVPNPGEDLVVSVSFRDIYKVIFFIAMAWLLGTLSVLIGLPSLVGEIFAGFLLGPPLADFVPYPGALVLAGNIGLIGLILESGIGLDVVQLTEVGRRALLLAAVGTILALMTGFGIGQWIGKDFKSSMAVGFAFAPSSLGVASAALSAGEVLNTPIGQLIVASSVFDDVFGLIGLSILQVFADPSPEPFDYVLPFIASFGYLIVLGYLGIYVLPKVIEKRILPLVSERNRESLAMVLMMLLMIAYMLALNYSGASYLTGVFLAGMTFSQVHSVHASFVTHAGPLLQWLLRIFFSATIGFQVPVTKFFDPYVAKWGFALLLPVFAKIPLGLLVPHFQSEIPDDFPYNPYYRDVIVTSLSMMCRGEFNFIVASYALSEGLFRPDVYSAVIFAVLFGSIVCPLVLSKVIRYYNEKSKEYLDGSHPIKRIDGTCDGLRPLYLAIQARTPVHRGLQEAFERTLAENGLLIIDHRNWHTLGTKKDSVDITELFVQDTKVKIRVKDCFGAMSQRSHEDVETKKTLEGDENTASGSVRRTNSAESSSTSSTIEDGLSEEEEIRQRCAEIKEALTLCLKKDSPEDYAIQVSQWQAFVVDKNPPDENNTGNDSKRTHRRFYSFHSFISEDGDKQAAATPEVTPLAESECDKQSCGRRTPIQRRASSFLRQCSTISDVRQAEEEPCLSSPDLWEVDDACHDATREGYTSKPDPNGTGMRNIAEGLGTGFREPPITPRSGHHDRARSFDASLLTTHSEISSIEKETAVIRERLSGYVRHHQLPKTGD